MRITLLFIMILLLSMYTYASDSFTIQTNLSSLYFDDFIILNDDAATNGNDYLDMPSASTVSGYSRMYSKISSTEESIDSRSNASRTNYTIYLEYTNSDSYSGSLNLKWDSPPSQQELILTDYGYDAARTTAVSNPIYMDLTSSYTISNYNGNKRYFKVEGWYDPTELVSNLTLNSGWNLISINLDDADSSTNRTFELTADMYNFIGYSSSIPLDIEDIIFTNSSGSSYTWDDAVLNGLIGSYAFYYDSSQKKYVAVTTSFFDKPNWFSHTFTAGNGYLVYAKQNGNITFPVIGGTYSNVTYPWQRLKFSNGTTSLGIRDADDAGWIWEEIQYYCAPETYCSIKEEPNIEELQKDTISAWEGIFVFSYVNNIKIIN